MRNARDIVDSNICPICDELVTAYLSGARSLKMELFEHIHSCPITVAACDAARADLAERAPIGLEILEEVSAK